MKNLTTESSQQMTSRSATPRGPGAVAQPVLSSAALRDRGASADAPRSATPQPYRTDLMGRSDRGGFDVMGHSSRGGFDVMGLTGIGGFDVMGSPSLGGFDVLGLTGFGSFDVMSSKN
jgi:hypothetical protein